MTCTRGIGSMACKKVKASLSQRIKFSMAFGLKAKRLRVLRKTSKLGTYSSEITKKMVHAIMVPLNTKMATNFMVSLKTT